MQSQDHPPAFVAGDGERTGSEDGARSDEGKHDESGGEHVDSCC